MSFREIKKGTASVEVIVRVIDATDGTPETGVDFEEGGIDLWYRRDGGLEVSITEKTQTVNGAYDSGGFVHISDGYCRIDVPDAAFLTGVDGVMVGGAITDMIVIGTYVPLVDYDPYDAVRLGLTALPDAAADAAGGLPISDDGALDMDLLTEIDGHVHNLASGTAGLNKVAKDADAGFTITTGTDEANTEDATHELAGVTHDLLDVGDEIDCYYEFNIGTEGAPIAVDWRGYVNAQGNTMGVYARDFGGTAWVQIGSIAGKAGSVVETHAFELAADNVETGVGTVRLRFYSVDVDKIATDRVFLTYTTVLSSAGIVNEWESQSQADPTGFHVNVLEVGGTSQTANDNGADINAILEDTDLIDDGTSGLVKIAADVADILNDTDLIDDGTSGLAKIASDVADILADTDVIDDGTSGLVKIAQDVAAILVDTDVIDDGTSGLVKIAADLADALADTNELQGDDIPGTLATIAAYLDTEIAAIVAAVITNADGTDVAADIIALKGVADTINTNAARLTAARAGALTDLIDAGRLDVLIDAIKAKTDNLPEEIQKNVALLNFPVVMVLAADHVTPATGKTVTVERYLDGATTGSAAGGVMTEAEFGLYHFDSAQADTNGDMGTWRFSETDCDDVFYSFKTVS